MADDVKAKTPVVVIVDGGVVQETVTLGDADVVILDWDNLQSLGLSDSDDVRRAMKDYLAHPTLPSNAMPPEILCLWEAWKGAHGPDWQRLVRENEGLSDCFEGLPT